jgi:cytoskeletal protein RodZ
MAPRKGTMDNTIGKKLSEARECLELSIEEMSIITRIPSEAIESLETSNFSDFPNSIYAESFLKLYCKHLDIDPKIFLNEIKAFFNENDHEVAYLRGAAANNEFTDLKKDESKNASPITLAAAVTILIIGVPSIIVLNSYKSEKKVSITPELYTPKSEKKNEIKSIAESLILEQGSEIKTDKSSSDETLLEKAEDHNSIKPAPKAIPIEKNPSTEQPVAFSTFG